MAVTMPPTPPLTASTSLLPKKRSRRIVVQEVDDDLPVLVDSVGEGVLLGGDGSLVDRVKKRRRFITAARTVSETL